ncbi:MAG: hypothetical protein ABIJ26_04235 [Candidatus Margulisiibacteriota bacterium]
MRKHLAILCVFIVLPILLAFNTPPPKHEAIIGKALIIDDFEDSNYDKDPSWWQFGALSLDAGKKALALQGVAGDYYVGGLGVYIASEDRDFSSFNFLEMDVFGGGPDSGTIKIELYEDDNNNWQIEQDPKKSYAPIYDDRIAAEVPVTWVGWKHVRISLAEFKDTNPGTGDDAWNPGKDDLSGGLLQMQMIVVASSKTGKVDMVIDNVAFTGKE